MFRLSHIAAPAALGLTLAFGVGCGDRYRNVPDDSVTLRESRHGSLGATAPHDGTVYVFDDSAHKLLYSGPVNQGDHVRVNVTADTITVNEKVVSQQEIDNNHHMKIFLDEAPYDRNATYRDVPRGAHELRYEDRERVEARPNGETTIVQPDSKTTVITKPNSDTTIIQSK